MSSSANQSTTVHFHAHVPPPSSHHCCLAQCLTPHTEGSIQEVNSKRPPGATETIRPRLHWSHLPRAHMCELSMRIDLASQWAHLQTRASNRSPHDCPSEMCHDVVAASLNISHLTLSAVLPADCVAVLCFSCCSGSGDGQEMADVPAHTAHPYT